MIESCVAGIKRLVVNDVLWNSPGTATHTRQRDDETARYLLIQELRDFYSSHRAEARFILMHRTLAILTSVHFSRPSEYFVTTNQWRHIYRHWKWAANADDVLSIRYEDVVCGPDSWKSQFAKLTGCQVSRRSATFTKMSPQDSTSSPQWPSRTGRT